MLQPRKPKIAELIFGQLVIGPPGSGKTTYCHKMLQLYKQLGRKACIVNLDPGNENMEYECEIDIMELVNVTDAMEHVKLGPNGALMYCIEYLEANIEWLLQALRAASQYNYFIFDCPGQVELYTHHESMSRIFERLEKLNFKLATINLIDAHHLSEPTKFVATLMLSLNMMLRMALPHVNVFSKADLLKQYEHKLAFNVDFYTDVLDLNFLLEALDNTPGMSKYKKLNAAICSVVEDYSLVSFHLLNVFSQRSLFRFRDQVDKANGYCFRAQEEPNVNQLLLTMAMTTESETKRHAEDIEPYL